MKLNQELFDSWYPYHKGSMDYLNIVVGLYYSDDIKYIVFRDFSCLDIVCRVGYDIDRVQKFVYENLTLDMDYEIIVEED